jgi:hypothetical protein
MFRDFAFHTGVPANPSILYKAHPHELTVMLEHVWAWQAMRPNIQLGRPGNRSLLSAVPDDTGTTPKTTTLHNTPPYVLSSVGSPPSGSLGVLNSLRNVVTRNNLSICDHLIYAYMVENTRVLDIFRAVVYEFTHGEKLGVPSADTQYWLRNTEELFFRDGAPFWIGNLQSSIRPDAGATRRNAYQRMFSMDLNHGTRDGKPYEHVKAEANNAEFVQTFEELLREVWVGMTYVTAATSANPTDTGKLAELVSKLENMLMTRRQNGNLSREEFVAVATMSWFHLALEDTGSGISPIVADLRAHADGTENRLFKIAERVGIPAHGLARHFFAISDPLSHILIGIESGLFSSSSTVPLLYTQAATNRAEEDMRSIITHWTAVTGRDVKASKTRAA